MALVVKQKAAEPLAAVKDGTYRARLTKIKQFTNTYGERLGFEFTIEGGDFDGERVLRSTAPQLTQQSKLAQVVEGVLGRSLTDKEFQAGIDLEALLGLECQLLVLQSRSKTGAVYSNVERVFAWEGLSTLANL